MEIEAEFGNIKEKQLKLTTKRLTITPQLLKGQTEQLAVPG